MPIDLYAVESHRDELLAKTQNPYFGAWWQQFLAQRETELEGPAYPDLPEMGTESVWEARHKRLVAASSRLHALSFAYALTQDRRFGQRAREIALALIEDSADWVAPVHKRFYTELNADLSYASLCIEFSVAFGWLAPFLDDADKARMTRTLAERGVVIYEDARRGVWWGDALNSNWTSHLMHGLGAVALALLPSQPKSARPWVEMATDRMRRMLDLARAEGAGIEGIGYFSFCYGSILRYATELRSVTGEDLFTHEFWRKCSLFLLYHTLPDLSGRAPLGDSGYPGLSGSVLLSGVARETRDGIAQWQTHRVMEAASAREIYDLIYYDPAVPETPPDALPPSRVFSSVQIATFRSGWDKDAVFMHFHGGSNTWSHCHLDLNAFTIDAFGERLAIDHGSWGYSPHYFSVVEPQISTAWHNTIVVDGADQRQAPRFRMSYDATEGGDCYSVLEQYLSCGGLEMIRGDATSAYGDMLDRCWREIVYLPPNRFVIYDNLRTNGARVQRHIQWLLHSQWPMQESESGIEIKGDKARLLVQPVFPADWRCRFPDRLARSHTYGETRQREATCLSLYPHWTHIWNERPEHSPYPQWEARGGRWLYGPDYPFLVVLTSIRAEAEIDWRVEPLQGEEVEGVRITSGEQVDTVLFKRYGGFYALGEVETDAEKVVLRERNGKLRCVAVVNGTVLRYRGEELLAESFPINRAWDVD